jgi:acetolactate synthase-1/2/3 large subunit
MTPLRYDEPVSVTTAIVSVLAEAGIGYVLGMPGGYTGPLFSAMHDHPTIRVVQVREESIGSTMAEAYGRLTGRPLVVMGQGEWIAGNAGQGFLEALLGSAPMLILTEMSDGGALSHHAPYQSGSGDYGSWDARGALAGVTKRVMVSRTAAQAVQHTQLALKHALVGQPGPVAVIYDGRALKGEVGPTSVPRIYPTTSYLPERSQAFDPVAVEAAAAAVAAAARPVIIAGNGVRVGQAWEQLAALAAGIDAPVATTAGGKGVFPEVDALAAGVMGTFGVPEANVLVGEADVVVAVGTKLAPIDTGDENPALIDPSRQTIVQIDVEPLNASWTFPVDHPLVGEAAVVMDRLREAVTAQGSPGRAATATERVARAREEHAEHDEAAASDSMPFEPQRTINIIQETFPADGVITCDAGENRLFMMHWFRTTSPGNYLQPAAGGGMGYAVASALGAKLARPDRPVLAVCGDGGFAMSLHALMTAVQEEIPITVVVFNNNALGWVLHGMGRRAVAANFAEFDHAAIAQSIGCEGVRVESAGELRSALTKATGAQRPFVIDVPTALTMSFKDIVQPLASNRWKGGD